MNKNIESPLISELKNSGLTGREAHIYLALLQKREFAASEIASLIPVGRTKIYEIIPRLISMGFCTEIQKDGKKIYRAVEPQIALHNILTSFEQELEDSSYKKEKQIEENFSQKKKLIEDEMDKKRKAIEDELNKKIKQLDEEHKIREKQIEENREQKIKLIDGRKNLINKLEAELEKIYTENINKSDVLDYIEILKDKKQIQQRWIELQENTEYEMLGFNKPPYSLPYKESTMHQGRMMKRKKMVHRGIYEYEDGSGSEHSDTLLRMEFDAKHGEECKVIDKLPMKLIIIDEKITMLALNDTVSMEQGVTTMIVTHSGYAKAQKEVFEAYWNKAIPLKEFRKMKKK